MMQKNSCDTYKFLDRRIACTNSRFEVYFDRLSLPEGGVLNDYITVRPRVQDVNGIAGVIVLPELDEKVGLMRIYRHQFDNEVWQAPGGFMEQGDTVLTAASRELREETGLIAAPNTLIPLANFCPDSGLIEAQVAIFLANCTNGMCEKDKIMEIGVARLEFFTHVELRNLLNSGALIGGSTMVAAYRYLDRLAGLI